MLRLSDSSRFIAALTVAAVLIGSASAQVTNTLIDFEAPGFDANSNTAVGDAGFDFFFSGSFGIPGDPNFDNFSGFIPNAPNLDIANPTIVTVAFDEAALDGDQSLVFFADVNSPLFQDDPAMNNDPRQLNLNVFQQQTITANDIGVTVDYTFLFSGAPMALNTSPLTEVEAFLITLDPNNNFNTTNEATLDLSGAVEGVTQMGLLELDLSAPELEGQILQFGVRNSFSDGQNPAVIVDNLQLIVDGGTLAGDFNGDDSVTGADYVAFRDGISPNGSGSLADFQAVFDNFGAPVSVVTSQGVSVVPEPSALLLVLAGVGAAAWRRR